MRRPGGAPRPIAAFVAAIVCAVASGVVLGRGSPLVTGSVHLRGEDAGLGCDASWYETGTTTASREPFDPGDLTAASRVLPLGSRVLVTALPTGRSVVVRVNDRGPFVSHRCIDLTRRAFQIISPLRAGLVRVRLEILREA